MVLLTPLVKLVRSKRDLFTRAKEDRLVVNLHQGSAIDDPELERFGHNRSLSFVGFSQAVDGIQRLFACIHPSKLEYPNNFISGPTAENLEFH